MVKIVAAIAAVVFVFWLSWPETRHVETPKEAAKKRAA